MLDKTPAADRILIAQLHGEAKHHARWLELTGAEYEAAVGELRKLAGGRGDLLAHVAGILLGAAEGGYDEPPPTRPPRCAARPGPTRAPSPDGPRKGAAGGPRRAACRSPGDCAGGPGRRPESVVPLRIRPPYSCAFA